MSGVRVPAPPPSTSRRRLRRIEPVLRRALRGPCALPAGSRVLVAVSGGADSTALLLGLSRLAPELGIEVCAAHLNHRLRGRGADEDQSFARALCARLAVPIEASRWNTRARMKRLGLSGQNGLRVLRGRFLVAAARRARAGFIATAHTADDQLETVLLRLARGAGLRGLGGMSARRGPRIRPLLEASRADIEADLRSVGQDWREDPSNQDLAYARNRVRHQVVPALLKVVGAFPTPRARRLLALRVESGVRELRSARRALEQWSARVFPTVARIKGREIALDSETLASYPYAIQRLILRRSWGAFGKARGGLTGRHLEASASLLASSRDRARVELPSRMRLERRGMDVRLGPTTTADQGRAVRVPTPGSCRWARGFASARWVSGDYARGTLPRKSGSEEYFAAEGVLGPLELRPATPDERFVPFGRRREQRLGRFLSRQRVAHALRERPLVLADSGGILWVVGVRRSARAPVTADTQRALRVRAEFHD